jgi:hypothetical protein
LAAITAEKTLPLQLANDSFASEEMANSNVYPCAIA